MVKITLTAKGGRGFVTRLDRWDANLKNPRPAFEAIADFQAEQFREQFASRGLLYGARWAPLSPGYARWKAAHFPGRPILVRTGRLRKSLTQRPLGIEEISKSGVRLGTDVEYAVFHQRGTKYMPRRQIYPTSARSASSGSKRIAKIMQRYITTGKV